MKVKSENTRLIIWALVALVIGVIIGMIITNATIGNATKIYGRNEKEYYGINRSNIIVNRQNNTISMPIEDLDQITIRRKYYMQEALEKICCDFLGAGWDYGIDSDGNSSVLIRCAGECTITDR